MHLVQGRDERERDVRRVQRAVVDEDALCDLRLDLGPVEGVVAVEGGQSLGGQRPDGEHVAEVDHQLRLKTRLPDELPADWPARDMDTQVNGIDQRSDRCRVTRQIIEA